MRVVSINLTHDSSVCSYVDGNIEFYCKEERLSRIKRGDEPWKSFLLYVSQNFGTIDHLLIHSPDMDGGQEDIDFYNLTIGKILDIELENYSDLNHHKCHASLAFYNSGFEEAIVFVIDRNGSIFFNNGRNIGRESESVYQASYPCNFKELYKSFWSRKGFSTDVIDAINNYYDAEVNVHNMVSIIKAYEAATVLLGEHPIENGKTMGLSAYGRDIEYFPLFINGSPIVNYFSAMDSLHDESFTCFRGYEHMNGRMEKDNWLLYADKAKHVQLETQKESLRLIEKYVNKTGIKNVCVVGGYGLNVVANNYYIKNLPDVNFYFEPVADDSGITIGASMLKYREETKDDKVYTLDNNFYHYYDRCEVNGDKKSIQDIVDLLKDQKVVAIFEGSPEAGPRALGHRSLLFDPRNKNGKDIMNSIKNREWYRPFAGVILEEHFSEWFETLGLERSEYMTINFECKDKTKEYVPAIVHVDNTCRVQTVSSGFLFDLLSLFYEQTGCPMLMNTSFNMAGDPLVHSVEDALEFVDNVKDNSLFAGVYFVDEQCFV